MEDISLLGLAIIGAMLTYWGTGVFRSFALKSSLLDIPNHRSSHTQPTPSAGGIVFVTVLQCIIVAFWLMGELPLNQAAALIIGGTLLSVFSFIDDRQHLRKRWRFAIQIICVATALTLIPKTNWPLPIALAIPQELLDYGYYLLTGLALIWLINLFNFMDGIDGLAITEAITVLANASFLLWLNNQPFYLTLCLAIPLLGFAALNFPPAKIFMGDTGSTFLGFLLGALALITASEGALNLWCWAILMSTFIADASYTLFYRILTGQNWREAHRSHCYQILARKTKSHKAVTIGNTLANMVWLLPIACFCQRHPDFGIYSLAFALLPILILTRITKAGTVKSD